MEASVERLVQQVMAARSGATPLRIRAGGTKDFYGNEPSGELLDPREHQGIVDYEPSELVVTARCGTQLALLQAELEAHGQMLAFEPPHFGPGATVGGCVASGLAGPRRAWVGSVRDFVLGASLLDGQAQVLRFGGTVMKNVAGYDVARLLAGSLGTLGLILQVSLKVLPKPPRELSLRLEMDEARSLERVNAWAGKPLPISASCWHDGRLSVRLSGAAAAVRAAQQELGGEALEAGAAQGYWQGLREHEDAFFSSAQGEALWRLSVPSSAPCLGLNGRQLIEWGGALRWLRTAEPAGRLRERAEALGGHATLFRGGDRRQGVFAALPGPIAQIHKRLKQQFDPVGIFNPGRLFRDL